MFHQTFTSRDLSQDLMGAERAAANGPVAIIEDGREAFVLISIEDYRRLTLARPSLIELLASPETDDIDFDVPRFKDLPRVVDLD